LVNFGYFDEWYRSDCVKHNSHCVLSMCFMKANTDVLLLLAEIEKSLFPTTILTELTWLLTRQNTFKNSDVLLFHVIFMLIINNSYNFVCLVFDGALECTMVSVN
jgi:hypothetical protein